MSDTRISVEGGITCLNCGLTTAVAKYIFTISSNRPGYRRYTCLCGYGTDFPTDKMHVIPRRIHSIYNNDIHVTSPITSLFSFRKYDKDRV